MKLIDITHTVQDAPIYEGSDPVDVKPILKMENGDPFNVCRITSGSHMGTHADALTHFLTDDETDVTIDRMPLERYYGPCRLITVPPNALVAKADLVGKAEGVTKLILRGGGNSYLTAEATRHLIEQGIETLLTDAVSVAPIDNETEIHQLLLRAGVAIVENVKLDHVADGDYLLAAFPVKYGGCDGAPVRAVLFAD